jgi:hypothetical protein
MEASHLGANRDKRQSNDLLFLLTEQKRRTRLSSFDTNIKERLVMTVQDLDTKQKLLDFISDKNKLSLKTNFDQKGTKEFLNEKNEAMKKIELNEDIEDDNTSDEKKDSPSHEKSHKKCVKFNLEGHKSTKLIIREKPTNKINFNKKGNSKSTKNLDKRFSNINESNNMLGFEAISKFPHWQPNTQVISYKKNRKSFSKKDIQKKNKNEIINIDKSINSITTVDSKLFDDKKDFEHYKHLIIADDDVSFIEGIINELD